MKSKIVILSTRFPYPLTKGDKVRLINHLRILSGHFEVYFICINDVFPDLEALQIVRRYCKQVSIHLIPSWERIFRSIIGFLRGLPLQISYFYDSHIKSLIQEEINEIEPIHIHCFLLRSLPLVVDLKYDCSMSIDLMDSMVLNDMALQHLKGPLALFRSVERKRIKDYESGVVRMFDHFMIISDRDRQALPDPIKNQTLILKNGVELSHTKKDDEKMYDVLFCGNLSYAPNQEAIRFICDSLIPEMPGINFCIAGAEMPHWIKKYNYSNLVLKADVPDLRAIYAQSKVFIAPIFQGSGLQNKVLEAMATKIPVITTPFVNDGIKAIHGEHLLLATSSQDFVLHINDLLSHSNKRETYASSALTLVQKEYNWEVNTKVLVDVISQYE